MSGAGAPREARRLRVLIVTDQWAPLVGGVPTATRGLADGLAGRGHEVAVLAPAPGRRAAAAPPGPARVHHLRSVPWPWYGGMRVACAPPPAVRSLVAGLRPDVVHIHSPLTLGLAARRAARRARIPVVYTNHYLPANARPAATGRPGRFDAAFYAFIVGFASGCDRVTAPTATALELLRRAGLRAPGQVISNGVDADRYSPGQADERLRSRYQLPAGQPLILSVGRLSAEKRVEVLLAAAARLTSGARLVIAGTGPHAPRLHAAAGRLGVAGRVSFLGHVPDPDLPGLYRLASVFAIASEAELQSLATLDAMASGLPVVAVDACALGELVRHGRNGFLCQPGNVHEIATYLDILINDPAERARMGGQSRLLARGHERHRGLAEWEALYRRLAAGLPAGREL